MAPQLVFLAIFALTSSIMVLADHFPLQDFCVADKRSSVRMNGLTCKDPMTVNADDFFFSGLHIAGNTSNAVGSKPTPVLVSQIPGLIALGVSFVRIDFAPWGFNPPHIHHRGSEIFSVIEGIIEVAFITSNPENRLITKVLQKGDVWVFPQGLVHYQRNVGNYHAFAIAGFNSQAPGAITMGNTLFGSQPQISTELLAKSFQVDNKTIKKLKSKFRV